jgi:hypothetical protein
MATLTLASTILIAVAGWVITQALARRAVKRNMRIEYLLNAYRRLDAAPNSEQMDHRSVESAISDVVLLGSQSEIALARKFTEEWQANNEADLTPLLRELRASLRHELLFEKVPPSDYFLLRLSPATAAVDAVDRLK